MDSQNIFYLAVLALAAVLAAVGASHSLRGRLEDGIVSGMCGLGALVLAVMVGPGSAQAQQPLAGARPAASAAPAVLHPIAMCESSGDPRAVSVDGRYRGKYQFDLATWRSVGGRGDPALAGEAEQDRRAASLLRKRGTGPWPVCGAGASERAGGHST